MATHWVVLIGGLVVLAGSVVQGSVGLGISQVAAPILMIIDPGLMPGSMILVAALLPVITLIREHSDIDWIGLAWAFPGRLIGTALGGWLVVVVSSDVLGFVLATMVLAAALVSLVHWRPRPRPGNLLAAGFVSGVGATATSIGGPPIALVYQNQHPAVVRSTLAVYFLVGNIFSIGALLAVGHLTARQGQFALIFLPFVIAGFALAVWLRRYLDLNKTRAAVLGLSVISSLVLIIRAVT
ncbi:hypothetical protein CLV47_102439 [Antricoccus suffuscus]|uniref:Probable membrane transporter protein n=1 Tax=Antricoccus suffuscus TaxID=1629062 RepID=A0A2T1A5Y6_9ACTN|nr:sulfite exporter TauE/SafE family protein [Antricoccus suffuscus]PRZ43748.1 hypothetical protein CLV47_102439 [Antricoccus suffuscus]